MHRGIAERSTGTRIVPTDYPRASLTISDVRGVALSDTANTGTRADLPRRREPGIVWSPLRASSETTSPIVLPSARAKLRAARTTSSSRWRLDFILSA